MKNHGDQDDVGGFPDRTDEKNIQKQEADGYLGEDEGEVIDENRDVLNLVRRCVCLAGSVRVP